jgi:hypothetical protein
MAAATLKEPIYKRIADDLRSGMAAQFSPGDMLPSENELVKRYAANRGTIRQSLDLLVREGLIRRYNGRGTVVVDRLATGECAIVLRPHLFGPHASPFYSLVSRAIMESIGTRHPQWNVRMHMGKATPTGREFAYTLDLMKPQVLPHLRGVFSFHTLYELESELAAANIPLVILGGSGKHWGFFALRSLFDEGVAHLREVGCRSVGAVWVSGKRESTPKDPHAALVADLLKSTTLECRPEWAQPYLGDATEHAGYESLMRLWQLDSRPESLLVVDDVICRGVLRAALHLGIDIPRQLRLVTFANRGVDLPYHKPVTRVEYDPAELVREAVDMMEVLQRGKEPERRVIEVPGKLVQGETT